MAGTYGVQQYVSVGLAEARAQSRALYIDGSSYAAVHGPLIDALGDNAGAADTSQLFFFVDILLRGQCVGYPRRSFNVGARSNVDPIDTRNFS